MNGRPQSPAGQAPSAPDPEHVPTILSGVQPSGDLHLGNYIGALRQWRRLLDDYDCYFCIVDLHALTDPTAVQHVQLRERVRDVAAVYVAAGIDPQRCAIFAQSDVPEHTALMWLLTCVTPMGSLERMTQFKAKAQRRERVDAGLLVYPVLQAADILLYDADLVPVGDDQRQHVELTRDVAQRFNNLYGEVFTLPEVRTPVTGARVMGLDDPTEKMSKSIGTTRPNHAIGLLDPPKTIRKKIARSQTDSNTAVDPENLSPGVANLIEMHAALRDLPVADAVAALAGESYRVLKETVADSVVAALEPIQQHYAELRKDESAIDEVLAAGAARAGERAGATLARAQRALRLR